MRGGATTCHCKHASVTVAVSRRNVMTTRFACRMKLVKPSAIRELLRFGADPSIISFGGGYPDATLFPLEELDAVFSRSILEHGHDTLQYTVSDGPPHLRAQIAARMANEGVTCTEDNILILQGGQQGLDLVAKLLVDKGDVIITEDPTFLGALIAFNPCEPTYACVGMDDEGMDTDALEARVDDTPRHQVHLHDPRLPEPDRRHDVAAPSPAPRRVGQPLRRHHPRGQPLSRDPVRGDIAADHQEPRHRGSGDLPRQLLEDPRPGSAARMGRRVGRHHRATRPVEARRRHPVQHPQHGGRLAVPRQLRHREPHRTRSVRSTAARRI